MAKATAKLQASKAQCAWVQRHVGKTCNVHKMETFQVSRRTVKAQDVIRMVEGLPDVRKAQLSFPGIV